jgi:predicted DNA-binding protein
MIDKEKRNERQKRYMQNQERLGFVMPLGTKERIQQAAERNGISCAEYVRQAIEEKLSKES